MTSKQRIEESLQPTVDAEEVTTGSNLTGKTALVTGCNSGNGFETMRVLAMRRAEVIGSARSLDTARDACAKVKGIVRPVACELTDLDSAPDAPMRSSPLRPRWTCSFATPG